MPNQIKLTPEQTNAVNAARRLLNDIVPDMDNLEKCGIDCQQLRKEKQQIETGLTNIAHYFGVSS